MPNVTDKVGLAYVLANMVDRWNREDAELASARAELTAEDRSHEDGENDGIYAAREAEVTETLRALGGVAA